MGFRLKKRLYVDFYLSILHEIVEKYAHHSNYMLFWINNFFNFLFYVFNFVFSVFNSEAAPSITSSYYLFYLVNYKIILSNFFF